MTGPINLQQRFALVKFLTEALAKLRADEMIPASQQEMPPGARMPVLFGGQLAAWVSMPQPSQPSARVEDAAKLLAWARKNHPGKVIPRTEIIDSDELRDHLAEHFPQALKATDELDSYWVSDLLSAMKDPGYYLTADGEKLTEVPGIALPEAGDPVPRVTLLPGAEQVIAAAWRDGSIPVGDLLALPGGGGDDA